MIEEYLGLRNELGQDGEGSRFFLVDFTQLSVPVKLTLVKRFMVEACILPLGVLTLRIQPRPLLVLFSDELLVLFRG